MASVTDIYVQTPEEVRALFPPSTDAEIIVPIHNSTVFFGLFKSCWSRQLMLDEKEELRISSKVSDDDLKRTYDKFDAILGKVAPPWGRAQFIAVLVMVGWLLVAMIGWQALQVATGCASSNTEDPAQTGGTESCSLSDAVSALILFLGIPCPMVGFLFLLGYFWPNKVDKKVRSQKD